MSDDFGTINVTRAERAREIEVMREHYRRHREALVSMIAEAPTEHLAQEYSRLVAEIDVALRKLDELEHSPASAASPPPPPPPPRGTEPGMRPLVTPPQPDYGVVTEDRKPGAPASRVVLILLAALVALGLIGWLIWRASDRGTKTGGEIVETSTVPAEETSTAQGTETVEPGTIPSVADAPAGSLTATPSSQDFGVIRKGTRAVRKFTLRNDSDSAVTLKVARSTCRCLYYQHPPTLAAGKQGTLTVTVDGAKAKAGSLKETIAVTTADPSVKTNVVIIATVR